MPTWIQPPEPCNKRYTQAERAEILAFAVQHNEEYGRGGKQAAVRKFDTSYGSINHWIRQAGATAKAAPKVRILGELLELQTRIWRAESELEWLQAELGRLTP